jgi:hypothetical protein
MTELPRRWKIVGKLGGRSAGEKVVRAATKSLLDLQYVYGLLFWERTTFFRKYAGLLDQGRGVVAMLGFYE